MELEVQENAVWKASYTSIPGRTKSGLCHGPTMDFVEETYAKVGLSGGIMDPTKGRTSRRSSTERRIINSLMEKRRGLPH